jgi:hypothetical protein
MREVVAVILLAADDLRHAATSARLVHFLSDLVVSLGNQSFELSEARLGPDSSEFWFPMRRVRRPRVTTRSHEYGIRMIYNGHFDVEILGLLRRASVIGAGLLSPIAVND